MSNLLDRYEQAVRRLAIAGTSTDSWVTVARDESGEISVRIERGALRSLDEGQLATEISSALMAAVAAHHDAWKKTRREFFGTALDGPGLAGSERP